MNNIKKYFEFSGTINGINYALRNLLAVFVAFISGFILGFGLGLEQPILTMLGVVGLVPTLWFNACTIYKRSNALFPEYATLYTIGMFLFQILDSVHVVFSVSVLIMGLILILKNSNIEEHNG